MRTPGKHGCAHVLPLKDNLQNIDEELWKDYKIKSQKIGSFVKNTTESLGKFTKN